MSKTRIISGIELGSSKVATIVAQVVQDPTTYEKVVNIVGVSSVESKGIKKGQIVDIEEAVEATITCLEAAERMAGYSLNSAYVSLGGAHVASQNSHGVVAISGANGEITPADVDRVVEAASAISLPSSREVIHVLPREYIVDGEPGVKDPVGMSGVRLEVDTHLITASGAAIKNLRKALLEVGVQIDDLVFPGLAAADAVLTKTEKELGCVVVDIGGGTTSVAAYIDGAITYSGVIPIGAKNVTNDLAIGLRVSLESAEKIKVALGSDLKGKEGEEDQLNLEKLGVGDSKRVSKKTLVEGIIRPRLNEIFTMVKIELDKAGVSSRIPSGAIICGGGAETVGVLESAKRVLTLPVRRGIPQGVSGLVDDVLTPAYAVPIGLILYGAGNEPVEVPGGIGKRFNISSEGIFGKAVKFVKDLLP